MDKRKVTILLILLLLALSLGVIFFNLANRPETATVEESILITEVTPSAVVEEEEDIIVEEEVEVYKPTRELPKTRISERKIWGGNNGYFVRDKEYVYFGISTTIREEVPVK